MNTTITTKTLPEILTSTCPHRQRGIVLALSHAASVLACTYLSDVPFLGDGFRDEANRLADVGEHSGRESVDECMDAASDVLLWLACLAGDVLSLTTVMEWLRAVPCPEPPRP